MARNLLRLYDRGAVEMPTILYTPNMDYKKYLILHSRSNYDADAPKDRYYILWFRDDADPVTTYTNSSYMQVQFVNSDTANPVFYCSSSYYTTSALAKEAMQKSTTGYSVPSLVRIFKLQTGTSSTSISLLGYYVNSNSTLRLAISGTETRDTITGLNYSNVTLTHAFSSETVRATGTPASSFVFHWLSTEQEQLTKPVLVDLSTSTECAFSFRNDTRAYAYKIFVNGVEMGYPLYWSATLDEEFYTVTMKDDAFPSAGTYSITAQAYVTDGSYADSEVSAPITFTKAASGYTVYISDSFVWADANPPEDVPTIHFVYSDGTSASVSCNSLAASYSNVKSFTVSGESMQDITYTEKGTSHTVGTGMTLTADITITRIEIYCLAGDTLITMADGTERRIDSLAVGDEVLSYNPVTMELEADRITYSDAGANKTYNYYDIWEFSDGRILKTVHRHRLYNVESQGMVNMDEWQLGEHALTRDGCAALVKHTHVSETVNHYTIFTGNQNYFANGLLAGNKYTPDMELCSLCG